jgi:hypothetical protein
MTSGFRPRRESQAESSLVAVLFIEDLAYNTGCFITFNEKYDPSWARGRSAPVGGAQRERQAVAGLGDHAIGDEVVKCDPSPARIGDLRSSANASAPRSTNVMPATDGFSQEPARFC